MDDSSRTDGIDEELEARRRRDSMDARERGPGASPGFTPAIEADQGTGTVGGFIGAAPDLAKVRSQHATTAFLLSEKRKVFF